MSDLKCAHLSWAKGAGFHSSSAEGAEILEKQGYDAKNGLLGWI